MVLGLGDGAGGGEGGGVGRGGGREVEVFWGREGFLTGLGRIYVGACCARGSRSRRSCGCWGGGRWGGG